MSLLPPQKMKVKVLIPVWDKLESILVRKFLQLAVEKLNVKISFGVDSMTGDGTPFKAKTISHGLSTTPTVVVGNVNNSRWVFAGDTVDASTFRAQLERHDAVGWNTTQAFYWIAIG